MNLCRRTYVEDQRGRLTDGRSRRIERRPADAVPARPNRQRMWGELFVIVHQMIGVGDPVGSRHHLRGHLMGAGKLRGPVVAAPFGTA